jgi:hypothetical protein
MRTLLLAVLAAAPVFAKDPAERATPRPMSAQSGPVRSVSGGSVKLIAYDAKGKTMDLPRLLAYIGRADRKEGAEGDPGFVVTAPDGLGWAKPTLRQTGSIITLSWPDLSRAVIGLPWPVEDDGFSTVTVDREGRGFSDGDVLYLNEEIALSEYRLFKESWVKHTKDMDPPYEPGPKAKKLAEQAKDSLAEAQASKEGSKRARAFDKALHETALAWEKMLYEHGLQIATNDRTKNTLRFGLTLDESLFQRLDHYQWIIDTIKHSGANWVRIVFRPNPNDFTYAKMSSFNEYDDIVKELRGAGIRVMGCVLDTNQWPSTMTPEIYKERTKNLVLHFSDNIKSWEVGTEINGKWLGGSKEPLSPSQVFKIFEAAAAQVKEIEPSLEVVATLYWWDGTAPDEEHTLTGWLTKFTPRGFGRHVDVVSLSLQPEDNPVGLDFEPIFERVRQFLPDKRLMLGSFGYVEQNDVKGYWWLHPSDVDGGRKDLMILYTVASCAVTRSVCGGFWWQTLDQMMPAKKKTTDLFRVYRRTMQQIGR